MKLFIFLLSILFFPLWLLAQQPPTSIIGTIKNEKGENLIGITVLLSKDTHEAAMDITDEQGKFKLENLAMGSYQLIASGIGYEEQRQEVILDKTGVLKLPITLKEVATLLEEIVVNSESQASILKKEGYAIESIETKAIQYQSTGLNQLLDQSAGIRVRQEGGLGSRTSYSINGLSGRAVRFFLDGVPMDYFGSSYSINTLPTSFIQRVDIYKGVVPVELGNDALGGAINLVTKKHFVNALELSYSIGSFNTHQVALTGNWRSKKMGLTARVSAFYNHSDNNYQIWGDDIYVTDPATFSIKRGIKVQRFHDKFSSKAIKTDLGFTDVKWAEQLLVGFLYSDMDKDIQHGPTMEVPYGEATYSQRVLMPYLTFSQRDLFLKGLSLNLFGAFSKLERTRIDTSRNIYNWYGQIEGSRTLGGEQTPSLNTLDEEVFIFRANLSYQIHKNHKIGYNHLLHYLKRTDRDPLITNKTDGYWAPQFLNKNSLGLAFQSTWFNKRLSTSIFVKWFQYHSTIKMAEIIAGNPIYNNIHAGHSNWGYGLAGSLEITSWLRLNTSFEQANRLPEASEILGDGLNILSTTTLRPERSLNINLGINTEIFTIKDHQLRWTINGFYRDVTDLIQRYQFDLGSFIYTNFDKVNMTGADTKLEYKCKDWFTTSQTASYLHPMIKSDKDELGNNNITYETRLPNTPFFQYNAECRFHLNKLFKIPSRLFLYWNLNYVGAFYKYSEIIGAHNKDQIPAQFVNNVGAGYTFPKINLSISIDCNNIFDQQAFDNFAIQKPGRAFFAKVTYSFIK